MLALLLVACAPAPVDTGAYEYTGPAWRPVIDGWIDGDYRCGTMEGPCFDCVEVSENRYVRWTLADDGAWSMSDYGVHHEVTPGDGSCEAIRLGAPLPESAD